MFAPVLLAEFSIPGSTPGSTITLLTNASPQDQCSGGKGLRFHDMPIGTIESKKKSN